MKRGRGEQRQRRQRRIRQHTRGDAQRPRISVFKSLSSLYVQAVDDSRGQTLAAFSNVRLKADARALGKQLAERLLSAGIKQALFDRGGYKYHGQIKALAEGMREGGIKM